MSGFYSSTVDRKRKFQTILQGAGENQLTSTMPSGLTAPEQRRGVAPELSPTWNQAAANTIAMLGRTPSGAFDLKQFVDEWNGATDAAKAIYTRGSPNMRAALDAAANLGAGSRLDRRGRRRR